jgi:outer membrane protein TolC
VEGTDYTTTASLDFTQPLLKNAWDNADIDYFIKLEQNNAGISKEQFKNDIREIISDIREKYWDWVLAAKTVSIRQTQLQYAENEMSYERTRFIIGEGTEMDTLSAALELLRARENLMTAEYEEKTSRKNLCLELDIPADSLAFSAEPVIALEPLPEPDIILQSAKENSKDLNVLELTRSSLILQEKKESNKLLPSVDLEAGIRNTRYGTQPFYDDNGTSAQPSQFDPYIGIRFTYDILARRERLSKKKTALNLVSSEIEKEQILREIRIDVENFIDAWHRDSARLAIRGKEITIAEKTYAQALEGYKIGTVDNLERLKAKNDLINSKLKLLNAEINLKKLEIAVDNATANTLKRFGVNLK